MTTPVACVIRVSKCSGYGDSPRYAKDFVTDSFADKSRPIKCRKAGRTSEGNTDSFKHEVRCYSVAYSSSSIPPPGLLKQSRDGDVGPRQGDICTTLGDQRSSLHFMRSPSMTRLIAIGVCLIGALLAEAHSGVTSCAALLQPRTAEGALKRKCSGWRRWRKKTATRSLAFSHHLSWIRPGKTSCTRVLKFWQASHSGRRR